MKTKLLLLVALHTLCLQSQEPAIQKVGIRDGLSSNYILHIAQDPGGNIWLATQDGLCRFDGSKYTSFYHDEQAGSNSLSGNDLNVVYADKEEPVIWIGTQRDGLDTYNYSRGVFGVYRHSRNDPKSIAANDITDIMDAGRGKLWMSTYSRGVELLDKRTGTFAHYDKNTVAGMPASGIWCMASDHRGHLFLGQVDNGLTIVDVARRKARNFRLDAGRPASLAGNDVRSICLDRYGQLWLGTHGAGLSLFDTRTLRFTAIASLKDFPPELSGCNVMDIRQIGNRIWVATEFHGVFIIDNTRFAATTAFRARHLTEGYHRNMLSCASVFSICADNFGNVWLGTWGSGVNIIGHLPQIFNNIAYGPDTENDETLTGKSVQCLCTAPDGSIWAGTEMGGINIIRDGRRIATLTRRGGTLPSDMMLAACRDSKGDLWFGTFDGWICKFNATTRALRKMRLLTGNHSDIRCLYENHSHQMCAGTSSGIFVIDLPTLAVKAHYDPANSCLPDALVRSICQDRAGRYWVGTFGNGLALLTPDMRHASIFDMHHRFCSNIINHLLPARDGTLWAATNNGVAHIDPAHPGRYRCYRQKDGLANNDTHSLAQDAEGNIWVSTNKGLSCVAAGQGRVFSFSNTDDIGYGEFCSSSVTSDTRGRLYFGYNGGVCYFRPSDIDPHYPLPPVRFTRIEVLQGVLWQSGRNISLANGEEVTLHHNENTFSIGFNLRDNALRGHANFAYRFKELGNTWFEVGHDQEVTFRNLPHGRYTLEVKARIGDREWGRQCATVVIDILPPWWLSWWARSFYVLLAAALTAYLFYAYRRRLLRQSAFRMQQANREKELELNNERLSFYTNIAHELRTPLTLIIGPLDDILRRGDLADILRRKMETINKNANRLLELVNQILEFRKSETQNRKLKVARQNIAKAVREEWLKFKEANKNPNLAFGIDISDENLTLLFDRDVITVIVDNLLSNAVKYTPSGNIITTVSTRREGDIPMVDISVIDTGYGIEPQALPHLFERFYQAGGEHQSFGTGIGLALVKRLADLHQGTLGVSSEVGKGSTFTFSLRADNTYPGLEHADTAAAAADSPTPSPTPAQNESETRRPLLLVVEDNAEIADYIHESLSPQFDVATAPDGKEGLDKALRLTPDVVVSDVMMPVMDGMELCRHLKNDIRTSHIPVILLTAKDTIENKEEGYLAGADSYITKPFSSTLLLSRINNLLASRQKLAQKTDIALLAQKKEKLDLYINEHDNEFIGRVTAIITDNLAQEKLDIAFVAERMNMSSSSLYRKMKALTGLSANEFIHKIKMNAAEKMLLQRKLTISEIAYKLGFSSPSYFRQCFRDDYGMAPSDYIRHLTGQGDETPET